MSAAGVPAELNNLGAPITATTQNPSGLADFQVTSDPAPAATQHDEHRSSAGNTLADEEGDKSVDAEKVEAMYTGDSKQKRLPADSSEDIVAELEPHHVSVHRGKEEFAALERKYSTLSQRSQHELHRPTTRHSIRSSFSRKDRVVSRLTQDEAEKAKEGEGEFNLVEVLRSSRENQDEAGIKRKAVGVIWEDHEVIGAGGMRINIRNFSSAIIEQFMMPALKVLGIFGVNPFAPKPKNILYPSSGLLKPGEMCLVLGRPEAGCTTFLKTITNQRAGYMDIKGNVEYAGVGWKEMRKRYGG